jgi:signal transduction histidine kinase
MTPRGQWQHCQADLRPLIKKVETWANLGVLLKPYLAFIYAEIACHQNQIRTARNRYLDAIASAHSQNYVLLAGHLHECVGDLLMESTSGNAEVYYAEARRLYTLCHAEAKIARLHESYANHSIVNNTVNNGLAIISESNELSTLPNLDINYLMKSALALSAETDLEQLLQKIMTVVLECSGAQHGYLLIKEQDELVVAAENHIGKQPILQTQHISMTKVPSVCPAIVNYVFRTHEKVVLSDACAEGDFQSVPDVQAMGLRSVLCLPVIKQGLLIGVLYLENRLSNGIFTREKTGMTELLTSHTAISLENARLLEETRRAYKELQESREHMMQMEKLSALGTLVGGVAHEINNPLMGVMNYVEFALEKTTDVKIHKVLDQALHEIGRIKTIVRNMLIYVRTKSNSTETCRISDTITQTLSLLEGEFKKSNVHINLNLPDNLPAIHFGADSLQQVLINILLNARDALSATPEPRIDITAQLNKTKLELNLCDNGSGISEAILSRIFDPFFTTKPPGKGTGLGLSVSYRLIEEAGGSIAVCNLPDGGCCMKLQFKIAA